jgi:hypothetical protein
VDLLTLYRRQTINHSQLASAVANSVWEAEITERFERFKATLKKLGYKKLTVGHHPVWQQNPQNNMVFAEPAVRVNGRVALWQGACDILGGHSCGNGLSGIDQAQLRLPPGAFTRFLGEHEL